MRANWTVLRKTLTLANTAYSQAIPENAMFVSVSSTSDTASFQLSLNPLQVAGVGTQYRTIPAMTTWEVQKPVFGTKTIYLSSATAGVEIEIEVWS